VGSAAAAVAALVLTLRADKARGAKDKPDQTASDPDQASRLDSSETPHELLVAWVQFLKSDIIDAVNVLHNRLNVISHTASGSLQDALTPDLKQNLERIRAETERATKIASGLLHRVNALAPHDAPAIVFQYEEEEFPSGHILLVENDEANQTVIRKVFERLGQTITVASNGYEAFAQLEENQVDCIISDVKMPYLDGRTLFQQVEEQKPHLASRFLFVTGDYTNPETVKFLKATGQPYIGKPYELDALLGAVAAILKSRVGGGVPPVAQEHQQP